MLRTSKTHCIIQNHKQPVGSISFKLATTQKCCAHLMHTAKDRSTNNSLLQFQSDSQQPHNAARTWRTRQYAEARTPNGSTLVRVATTGQCCAHLLHTAEYKGTDKAFDIFRSDSQQLENVAHTAEYRNTSIPSAAFRSNSQQQKMLRTPNAHCKRQQRKQPSDTSSIKLVKTILSTRKCCANLWHTAESRSTHNPLVPFLSDSRQTENAAHT